MLVIGGGADRCGRRGGKVRREDARIIRVNDINVIEDGIPQGRVKNAVGGIGYQMQAGGDAVHNQPGFITTMQAGLAGQLAVIVEGQMHGVVQIFEVMRQRARRGEQIGPVVHGGGGGELGAQGFVIIHGRPRHHADIGDGGGTVLGDQDIDVARKGVGEKFRVIVDVDEVIAGRFDGGGVGEPVGVVLEIRAQRVGQFGDGGIGEEAVADGAPSEGGGGKRDTD